MKTGSVWMHLKTGGIYSVIGLCMMEKEWEEGVLYQSVDRPDTLPIVRNKAEFLDGRFEEIEGLEEI